MQRPQPAPGSAPQLAPAPAPAAEAATPRQPASDLQPAPQPMSGLDMQPAPQPERYRVHHSFIWLSCVKTLASLIVIGAASLATMLLQDSLSGSQQDLLIDLLFVGMVVGLCALGLIVSALYYWWSWRHLYYELGPEEFNLYSGIFNKKRVHVPYRRIQSVDQQATLLQRVFGVCTVSIDTAGGSANKAVTVPYVRKAQAEDLRRKLFARKQLLTGEPASVSPAADAAVPLAASPAPPQQPAPSTPPARPQQPASAASVPAAAAAGGAGGNVLDRPAHLWESAGGGVFAGATVQAGCALFEYGLTNKQLAFTGLANNTAFYAVLLGLLGAVAQVASLLSVPVAADSSETVLEYATVAGLYLFGGNLVAVFMLALACVAVVMWLFSTAAACVSYGGFRARRFERRIEVERGLLQHRVQGVDVDRVQFVRVRQRLIPRLMGYCELSLGKVDAAGDGDVLEGGDVHSVVIHPFVRLDEVPFILRGLIPEFADMPVQSVPVAPVALRRAVVRRSVLRGSGFWLAVAVAAAQICANALLSPTDLQEAFVLSLVNTGAIAAYVVCVVLFVCDIAGSVLWFRESSYACDGRFMQVSNGGFTRESIGLPRSKMQCCSLKTNPFQRRAHTATICVSTAAGVGGTDVQLVDVREQDATAWLQWACPQGNVLQ